MKEGYSFMIADNLIPALGYAWNGPKTVISPLNYPDSPEMEKFIPYLKEQGLVGPDGQLVADVKSVVGKLSRARTFTRVFLTSRFGFFEFVIYFTPDGSWVSFSRRGESVRIEDPGTINEIVEAIRQQIGESMFTSGSLHATLEPAEALVLGAMWDLQRKQNLKALAGGNEIVPAAWRISQVLEQASKKDENVQWLTNVVRTWTGFEENLSEGEARRAADTLVAKEYCKEEGGAYKLTGESLDLALNMLIFSNAVTLTSGIEGADGKVTIVGFSCIQAGVHDLLMIDFEEGKLGLDSVSASEVIDYIDAFMRKPLELLSPFVLKPAAGARTAPVRKCPKCNNPLTGNEQFCGKCGAAFAPAATPFQARTCPKCGSPVTHGKKFCGKCGAALQP